MYINNYHNYQIIYKQFIKIVMTKVVSLYTYIFLESCVPRPWSFKNRVWLNSNTF